METTKTKKTTGKTGKQAETSYDKAFARLQEIVSEMESETITVDRLTVRLKEAVALLALCRKKLHSTEDEVREILKELE